MVKKQSVLFWSGGKDCAYSLYILQQQSDISVNQLYVTLNSDKNISMHGVDKELIEKQSESLGIPVKFGLLSHKPSNREYRAVLKRAVWSLKKDGIEYAVFGDLFLTDIRAYREELFKKLGLKTMFPLWNRNTAVLSEEIIENGFKAKVVSLDSAQLDHSLAGSEYDQSFLSELPESVDPCGENGEFHTYVYDGPIFSEPIHIEAGAVSESVFPSPGNPSEKYRIAYSKLQRV